MSCICQYPEATQVTENGIVYCETIDTLPPSCEPKSCPPNYELVDGECVRNFDTGQLCPEGYIYVYDEEQPSNSRCEFYTTSLATCTCAADVIAQPQTICSGGVTSIELTSTFPGTVFSWTANPIGVTGATQGSGNTISQTLETTGIVQGTVSYVITPYEPGSEGCAGTPITVLATVNPLPSISAIPASPQTVTSGDTLNITLSSVLVGTTFTWTATASNITGATSGSGNTITDTLTSPTGGSVTYNILATAPNGCTNTLEYTVNMGTTVVECLRELTARVFYDDLGEYTAKYINTSVVVTGTSGSGTLNIDNLVGTPVAYPITFSTSPSATAAAFVSANTAALNAEGIIIFGNGGNITIRKPNTTAPTVTFSSSSGDLNCAITPATSFSTIQRNRVTVPNFSALPPTGVLLEVYRTTNDGLIWCWNGQSYVPAASLGVTVMAFWNPITSTIGHTCNRAKYSFMTNGLAIDCYHYPPVTTIPPSPNNTPIPVNYVNLNNTGSPDDNNVIVYNRFTSPVLGEPDSRESFAEYSNIQSAIIQNGLPSSTSSLKIRLKGLNVVLNPPIPGGNLTGYWYNQHTDVVGLEFYIDGDLAWQGVIGSETFEIDPCTFFPGQTLNTYESSTGGTGKISSIAIGTQTGTLTAGAAVAPSTVTQNITVNATLLGTYDFIGYANGVTFRATGTFTTLGSQTVTMEALGTPITSGVSTFELDLAIPHPSYGNLWEVPPTFNITVL